MSELFNAHIAKFYAQKVKRLEKDVRFVTAGQVASFCGVSRTTAKKHLENAVTLGLLEERDFQHVNGMRSTCYRTPGRGE